MGLRKKACYRQGGNRGNRKEKQDPGIRQSQEITHCTGEQGLQEGVSLEEGGCQKGPGSKMILNNSALVGGRRQNSFNSKSIFVSYFRQCIVFLN